ncbi:hypothetical protein BGZ46_003438 [Entomortierella lignicola]|nr:hypothetical protein BGZ46_003438 [Entomortierella lignicola]
MKSTAISTFCLLLVLAYSSTSVVQGGQIFSHTHAPPNHRRNNDPNDFNNHLHNNDINRPNTASHLEWNSQIGASPSPPTGPAAHQQSRQGGERGQFQPYANFALQDDQNIPQFGQAQPSPAAGSGSTGTVDTPCRSRDRVYLPDMQSFLIQSALTYQEAVQACVACGSELVLIDGTNIDRFQEAFSSIGLYGDQRLWIKSWFGEYVANGACPATFINSAMGNRLDRKTYY